VWPIRGFPASSASIVSPLAWWVQASSVEGRYDARRLDLAPVRDLERRHPGSGAMSMAIMVPCGCGKTMHVPEEHAGKRVKCPACGSAQSVPVQATPKVLVASEPVAAVASPVPVPSPVPSPVASPVPVPAAVPSPAPRPPAAKDHPAEGGLIFLRGCLGTIAVVAALCFVMGPWHSLVSEDRYESDKASAVYHGDHAKMRDLEDERNRSNDTTEQVSQTAVICLTVALAGLAMTSGPMRPSRT
jgi:hypothetical protein